MIPRRRRSLRLLLIFVLAVCAVMAVLVSISQTFNSSNNLPPFRQLETSGSGHVTSAPVHGAMFTSEELRYLLYGEGEMPVAEDDPRYMVYIKSHMTRPTNNLRLNLADKSGRKHFSQARQSEFVDKRLSQRRNGFYVECGAVDGETLSNTLFFELERNWTGLLVEANPAYYSKLLSKNRKAYFLGGCLSPKRRPMSISFRPAGVFGGIDEKMEKTHADFVGRRADGRSTVTVQCFPLADVLASLDVHHIDYLSLDVEGPEVEILRTVDWNRVRVDILTVEYRVITPVPRVMIDIDATAKKLEDIRRLFNETGLYSEVARLNSLDVVFERKDLTSI